MPNRPDALSRSWPLPGLSYRVVHACEETDRCPTCRALLVFEIDELGYVADYCPRCGYRLRIPRRVPTDADQAKSRRRLTVFAVRQIKRRLALGEDVLALARHYGVTRQAIYDIRDGKTWVNVPPSK